MTSTKIATCCYCGTRAALVLRGAERHELSCASCGAPLHDLKMLRADHRADREPVKPLPARAPRPGPANRAPKYDPRKKKAKRRKGLGRWFLEEAIDAIEDIFD